MKLVWFAMFVLVGPLAVIVYSLRQILGELKNYKIGKKTGHRSL